MSEGTRHGDGWRWVVAWVSVALAGALLVLLVARHAGDVGNPGWNTSFPTAPVPVPVPTDGAGERELTVGR